MNDQSNKEAWERLARLGEMIGDGLHHEEPFARFILSLKGFAFVAETKPNINNLNKT